MQVKGVPKVRLGIFPSLLLGEGYKRRRLHHTGRTRVTQNHRGCMSSRRAMERMGMKERAEDSEAVMNMEVMEAGDHRKSFMQTAEAMVRKGMEQEDNMNRRAAIGRKDMKEMAKDVRKSFMRATEAVVKDMKGGDEGCINKRAMGSKGMERAEDTTNAMMSMKAKEEEVMLMKVMEAEDSRKSFMKAADSMVKKGMEGEEGQRRITREKDKESTGSKCMEEGPQGAKVKSTMKQKVQWDIMLEKAMEEKHMGVCIL
jgi:hypothetical protein